MGFAMIDREEIRAFARDWGVGPPMILKDHLVSHLLRSLEAVPGVVFFGGTALSRTHLKSRRLSEDVDLYLEPERPATRDEISTSLQAGTRRDFPDLRVEQVSRVSDVTTHDVTFRDVSVKLQIVGDRSEHRAYAVVETAVALHYSDLPPSAQLAVPTIPTFGAMKLGAYEDRHAARDLFDLAGLVAKSGLAEESISILRRVRGAGPVKYEYQDRLRPTDGEWQAELGHQTRDAGDPQQALETVRAVLQNMRVW